jgi:TonB family protein
MVTDELPDIRRWRNLLPLRAEVVVRVEASGLVSSVRIEESTGFPQVDAAIMAAARHWVFERSRGTPAVQGSRSIVFTSAEAR